ncbi:UDP-N-acetylmuramate dehydrogenase [Cognatilysobacter lacus]|uniref:UDP-N-acetylenolpyruvoylglucosamine reductase n=1 Tax=Cognatilysobacter lacus TaxID=1643323 RepID=A0A5D8Z3C7_9GAMM|nr:UDP-N-acetylmuramate dehydrogenase [Lysobacter lacus]TZF89157.1 UDP-N-acetylmuramate dehydrogenase [Lysobacter lacus]
MTEPGIRITRDADLRALNTFGVAARAPWLVDVAHASMLPAAFASAPMAEGAPLVLGGGSNILFVDAPPGPVLRLSGTAIRVLADDDEDVRLYADAGVEWHALVMRALDDGFTGLENLALIPGTVGAAPIQNIGAYGVEVGECIDAVQVFEPATGLALRLPREACAFAYRDSLFKREPSRYVVTGVEFRLQRNGAPNLSYAGLGDELAARGIASPTARDVSNAVIAIRRRKLPDPSVIGNAGSFFKNPIVPAARAEELAAAHARLPVFPAGQGLAKLSAAWLIDNCGLRGYRSGDAGVSAGHALVLVNHGGATGRELLDVARHVASVVRERHGVGLEPEPRMVGASWLPD